MLNKKGVSDVITTVLLILIVLAAIGIVWMVISIFLSTSTSQIGSFNLARLTILENSLYYNSTEDSLYFKVHRDNQLGNVTGIKVILENDKESSSFNVNLNISILETKGVKIFINGSIVNFTKITIYPIFLQENGKTYIGQTSSQVIVSNVNMISSIPGDDGNSGGCPPNCQAGATQISISDDVIQTSVKRLGINIGSLNEFDNSIQFMKNVITNPGYEGMEYREVVLMEYVESPLNSNVYQYYWEPSWNQPSCSWNIGQPEGFWNNSDYEIAYGPSKGVSGKVLNFSFGVYNGNSKNVYMLDKKLNSVNSMDVMFVRKKFSPYLPCQDASYLADNTTIRPGSAGQQSLKLAPGAENLRFMDSFYRDGDKNSNKEFIVKGNWVYGVWAKAQNNGASLKATWVRPGEATFLDKTFTLTTNWQYYEFNFSVPDGTDPNLAYPSNFRPILELRLTSPSTNIGYIWIDDAKMERTDQTNPTDFSDALVNRLKELNPGIIRDWSGQLGAGLDQQTGDVYGEGTDGFKIGNFNGDFHYTLNQFLKLTKEVNADPWYVIPPTYTQQEAQGLMDFLAGPTTTYYGARRAALGHPAPWTDDFNNIYVEYGNELWGSGAGGDPFAGATMQGGTRVGAIANNTFDIMKKSQNYNSKIKFIIGGQAGWADQNGYIQSNSNNHNMLALAPYFDVPTDVTNLDDTEKLFSSLYADSDYSVKYGNMKLIKDIIDTGGQNTEMAVYEINYHSTYDSTTGLPPYERNLVMTGEGGGLVLPLNMLNYMKYLGVKAQTAFSTSQYSFKIDNGYYVKIWGMILDINDPGSKRGTWLSNEVANKGIFGNMVNTTQSGINPNWTEYDMDDSGNDITSSYIQSFSFKDTASNKRSLVVFNLNTTDPLNILISTPVNPSNSAVVYTLSSNNIYDNNENVSGTIGYTTTQINNFANNYPLSLPPHSLTTVVWQD
ncbi:MAG: hypothetical protein AABW91_00710 [Nanoarchaeota archaeon]